MITIKVTQKIEAPVAHVSQVLLDHTQLDRFFNARVALIKVEDDGEVIGGKGAIRQISIGKIIFEEQIISASNEHICYRIIGNWPVSNHQGDIHLTPKLASQVTSLGSSTTQLDYIIKFSGPKWFPSILLKFFVERDIVNAMKKLALHFASGNYSTGNFA